MFDGRYKLWGGEHSLFTRKLQAMLNRSAWQLIVSGAPTFFGASLTVTSASKGCAKETLTQRQSLTSSAPTLVRVVDEK